MFKDHGRCKSKSLLIATYYEILKNTFKKMMEKREKKFHYVGNILIYFHKLGWCGIDFIAWLKKKLF